MKDAEWGSTAGCTCTVTSSQKEKKKEKEKKNEVFSFKSNIEHNSNTKLKEISISNTLFNILKVTS